MNEDYLWNKTGDDPEIERLENALRTLAYKETEPPTIAVLPAKVLPFKQKPAHRAFRFAYAAAACLAFVAIGLGILIPAFKSESPNQDSAKTIEFEKPFVSANESDVKNLPDADVKNPEVLIAEKPENSKRFAVSKIVKARRNTQPVVSLKETKTARVKAVKPEIRLTEEERYAYDQLRLALSITSSKLKLVKNKVESVEEKNVERSGGR
jgi:hypothetical protein